MIDLTKYRIIDLSHELFPSEQKTDGRQRHGKPFFGERAIDLQEFYHATDGSRMHFIQSQTHNGTHVEAAYKYSETGADVADTPLDTYLGEAAACNFTGRDGGPITPDDLRDAGVGSGDIVLAWGAPGPRATRPYLTAETVDWFIETRIKALGVENLSLSPPDRPSSPDNTANNHDARVLLAGIGLIDAPTGLDQITRPRVFFIGLPVRMHRITASWTRAIALEETGG